MFEAYRKKFEQLTRRAKTLQQTAEQAGEKELAARLGSAVHRIGLRQFHLAVVGEFKAGKSTLINALCGREVLPVASRECTAVVTRLRTKRENETAGARVVLETGEEKRVSIEDLKGLLTVQTAEVDGVPVVEAEVLLDSTGWLGDGVELVDTPGVNAAGLARERATLEYLPSADAIVFMTRADALLTDSEITFLKERVLGDDLARLFVVVNFMDRVKSADDRRDLLQRARNLLEEVTGPRPVHLISAQEAIYAEEDGDEDALAASGVPSLKEALGDFLANERAQAEYERQYRNLSALSAELERALSRKVEALQLNSDVATRRANRIEEYIALARQENQNIREAVHQKFSQAMSRIESSSLSDLPSKLNSKLERLNQSGEDVDEQAARRAADEVGGAALSSMQQFLRSEVRTVHQDIASRLRTLFDNLDREIGGGETAIVPASVDFGSLVEIRTTTEEVTRQEPRQSGTTEEAAASAAIAGGVAALVGGLLFGPLGFYAGAAIGGGAGWQAGREQKSVFNVIKDKVVRRKADGTSAGRQIRGQLSRIASQSVDSIRDRTVTDVEAIINSKIREMEEQKDMLLRQAAGGTGVDRTELDGLLSQVRESQAALPSPDAQI